MERIHVAYKSCKIIVKYICMAFTLELWDYFREQNQVSGKTCNCYASNTAENIKPLLPPNPCTLPILTSIALLFSTNQTRVK